MLSADGVIDLESLLGGHANTIVLTDGSFSTDGLNWSWNERVERAADEASPGEVRVYYDLSTGAISFGSSGFSRGNPSFEAGDASTDADSHAPLETMRGFLPNAPMKPLEAGPPAVSNPAVAMIAVSTLLRKQEPGETLAAVPTGMPANGAIATQAGRRVLPLVSAESTRPAAPLALASGDQDRLERSWSFEVVALPGEESAETKASSLQGSPAQPLTPAGAVREVSNSQASLHSVRDVEEPVPALFVAFAEEEADEETVGRGLKAMEAEQDAHDAAFAGWTGHAEIRRHAVTGALFAVLAASRWRAPRAAPQTQHEQRPGEISPLRRR